MTQHAVPLTMDAASWRHRLQAELDRYLALLLEHVAPEKVILFGSLAQDEVQAWSDTARRRLSALPVLDPHFPKPSQGLPPRPDVR
jgi:hypothetical protein